MHRGSAHSRLIFICQVYLGFSLPVMVQSSVMQFTGSITYQEAEHGDMVSQLVPHELTLLNMPWILGQPVSSWNGLMCHGSAGEL
jgi:hypothetical protein